jgi:hypothetical protein
MNIIKSIFHNIITCFGLIAYTPEQRIIRTIRSLGYSRDYSGAFVKHGWEGGRTMIWILSTGIRIKAYGGGYGESDFLEDPITDMKKLRSFIRRNEV